MARRLCREVELPEGGTLGVAPAAGSRYAGLVLVRRAGRIYAYRNACPHTGAPMESDDGGFMDYTGRYLMCALHGAVFRIEDGYCLWGPCERHRLAAVAVEVCGEWIVAPALSADPPAEDALP